MFENWSKFWDFFPQRTKLTIDQINVSDLTEYRLSILKRTGENLLKVGGYTISDAGDNWLHFTRKHSERKGERNRKMSIVCGAVINSSTKAKETQITSEQYRGLCLKDLQTMSERKNSESNNKEVLSILADTSVKISLLQVKSTQTVSLNLSSEFREQRDTGNKGGVFLQYNSSRLAALRKKHEQLVCDGIYPRLPQIECVDYSLLTEPEEWSLMFNFLLEFPSLVARLSEEMAAGKPQVHLLCSFAGKLCSVFSVYYRRIRILLEPKEHLLPKIHARLLLCMAIEQVLENVMDILCIKKIEEM